MGNYPKEDTTTSVTITQGTQTLIQTALIGGTETQVIRLDQGTGTVSSLFSGTFMGGTLNAGTVTQLTSGTVDTIGFTHAQYFATTVFTGTNVMGTIKPAIGAGTRIYVTDLIISVGSVSNVVLGDGTITTPLAGTFFFAANGGLTSNFRTPLRTSQGGTLVFQQSAAIGSCTITAFGYTAP